MRGRRGRGRGGGAMLGAGGVRSRSQVLHEVRQGWSACRTHRVLWNLGLFGQHEAGTVCSWNIYLGKSPRGWISVRTYRHLLWNLLASNRRPTTRDKSVREFRVPCDTSITIDYRSSIPKQIITACAHVKKRAAHIDRSCLPGQKNGTAGPPLTPNR